MHKTRSSFRDDSFLIGGHRSPTVILQLILLAVLFRCWLVVGVLVRVVVRQSHLSKLLLGSERLRPRLQMLNKELREQC